MESHGHRTPEEKTLSAYLPHIVYEIDRGRPFYNKTQVVLSLVNPWGDKDAVVEDNNPTTASGIRWYLEKDNGRRLGCSVNVGKKPDAMAVGKFASYVASNVISEKNLSGLQKEMTEEYRKCFEEYTPPVGQILIKRPSENELQVLLGNTDLNSRIALIRPFDSEIALALIFDSIVLGMAKYKLKAHEEILEELISEKAY